MRQEIVRLQHLPPQQDFFFDSSRLLAFVGGIGSGKTYVASDKMLALIMRYPLARFFILSNTFAQLKSGTMMTFFARCRHWGFTYVDRIREKYVIVEKWVGPQRIRAKIECWTADDYELFRSLEVDFAWLDEGHVWPKMAFLTFLGRLRGYEGTREVYGDIGQQLFVTANPPHTTDHWLVDFTTKPPNEADDELMALVGAIEQERSNPDEPQAPPMKLYTSSTFDNPFLSKAYIRTLLETMDPELVDIELKGNFGDIGKGKIWRSFSRSKHIVTAAMARDYGIPPLEWDPESEVCWTQDFNIDPLCTVLFQWRRVKAKGFQPIVMYVLDEMRIRDARLEYAGREFGNRTLPLQIAKRNGLVLYGDPSGDNRRLSAEADWIELRKHIAANGVSITRRIPPAAPLRRNRYAAANAKLVNGLGEIGVVFHPRCKYLAIDLNTQFYKPGTSEPLVKKAEDGVTNTHFGDAWSYPIAEDFPVAAPAKGADPRR